MKKRISITNACIILLTFVLIGYMLIPVSHAANLLESASNPMFEEVVKCRNKTHVYSLHVAESLTCNDNGKDSKTFNDSYVYIDFDKGISTAADSVDCKYFNADILSSVPISGCKDQVQYVNGILNSYTDITNLDDCSLLTDQLAIGINSYKIDCNLYSDAFKAQQNDVNQNAVVSLSRSKDLVYVDTIVLNQDYVHEGNTYHKQKIFIFEPLAPDTDITVLDPLYSGCLCESIDTECKCGSECDDADGCESFNYLGKVKRYEKDKT